MAASPLWILRSCWIAVPLIAGPAVADAFADRSSAVQTTAAVIAWTAWAVAMAATLVPRTATLTALRMLVPGAVVLSAWSAIDADRAAWAAAGVAIGAAAIVALSAPAVIDAFVDGSSYGDEKRVALRTPPPLFLLVVPLAWGVTAAAVAAGPLLLATEQWVAGALVTTAAVGLVVLLVPRLHQLARRWLVFVPAGVVVHDPVALAEPVLLPRHLLRRFGPAEVGTDAVDLTGGGFGLALELRTAQPIEIGARSGRAAIETTGVDAVLVSPVRPGATLDLAEQRRLPVG